MRVDVGIDPYEPLKVGNFPNFIRQIFNGRTRNETFLCTVRSGNPILRSPARAFLNRQCNENTCNGTTCFSARQRYFVLQRPFLPYLFPQEGKDMVAEGTVTAAL